MDLFQGEIFVFTPKGKVKAVPVEFITSSTRQRPCRRPRATWTGLPEPRRFPRCQGPQTRRSQAMSSKTALSDALDSLCERFGVAELYVFGSRASEIAGRVHGRLNAAPHQAAAASDVDLAVRPRTGRRLDVDAVV
ncbi:MAG: hypothetical protein Q8N53_03155, partial [Longimicrobiales bacterium]|nr:hypothetical protein [Longimicrobiales bacterium]